MYDGLEDPFFWQQYSDVQVNSWWILSSKHLDFPSDPLWLDYTEIRMKVKHKISFGVQILIKVKAIPSLFFFLL